MDKDKVTGMVSNGPNLVSPSHSSVALPSSPGHPGSSTLIDDHFGRSLTRKQTHYGTSMKGFYKGSRCVYTLHNALHLLLTGAM